MLQYPVCSLKGNILNLHGRKYPEFTGQEGCSSASLDRRWGRNGSKPAQVGGVGDADVEKAEPGEEINSSCPHCLHVSSRMHLEVWMCSRGAQGPTLRQRMLTTHSQPLSSDISGELRENLSWNAQELAGWSLQEWGEEGKIPFAVTNPPSWGSWSISWTDRDGGDLGTAADGARRDFPAERPLRHGKRRGNEVIQEGLFW